MVQLSGDDVNLVHHAYGSNGIITEVEMPLAPAWPWREAIVAVPRIHDGGELRACARHVGRHRQEADLGAQLADPGMLPPLGPSCGRQGMVLA